MAMRSIICILGLVLLVCCTAPQKEFPPGNVLNGVETILIMPFQNLHATHGSEVDIDCPFCNRRHVFEEVPEGATKFMTEHLINLLMNDRAYRFVFPEETEETLSSLQVDENGVVRMTDLPAISGDTNGVDAVLLGYLFRFKERVGTRYSVESPASVTFSLFLVRVADGCIVWRGTFEETQQSLSEDLLKIGAFIKRKARWVTAREMAADGLENLISTFPKP
jgi:hypothetical protein